MHCGFGPTDSFRTEKSVKTATGEVAIHTIIHAETLLGCCLDCAGIVPVFWLTFGSISVYLSSPRSTA